MSILTAEQNRYQSATEPVQSDAGRVRSLGTSGGSPTQRQDLPAFVDAHEMRDPGVASRVPVSETEAQPVEALADSPATGVAALARSSNWRVHPVVKLDLPKRSFQQRSQVLQQWEGTVVEVKNGSFGARMKNLTDTTGPEEWATMLVDEVTEDERHLVQPGAIFYWSVGYLTEPSGQRRTASSTYFRRLPAWTVDGLERVRVAADTFLDVFPDDQTK